MGRTNGYKHAFHPTPNQLTPHTHTNNPHRRLQLRRVGALRGAVPDHAGGHGLLRLPLRQRLRGPPHVQARVRVCVCVCVCACLVFVCVCVSPLLATPANVQAGVRGPTQSFCLFALAAPRRRAHA